MLIKSIHESFNEQDIVWIHSQEHHSTMILKNESTTNSEPCTKCAREQTMTRRRLYAQLMPAFPRPLSGKQQPLLPAG